MRKGPSVSPAVRQRTRAGKRRAFHADRIAAAPTPGKRAEYAMDQIRAEMARADDPGRERIAARFAGALPLILGEEDGGPDERA